MTSIVLLSGGLDSAVLLALEARSADVRPVHVSVGLAWEPAEQTMLSRLLAAPVFAGRVAALAQLEFNMRDIYAPTHWAVRGVPPAYDTPDEDVYLAGRNLVLLTKAGVAAAAAKAARIVLGTLANNPFPDATPEFFAATSRALSLGLAHPVEIAAPLAAMHKEEAIRLGVELGVPFEFTLSCMNPIWGKKVQEVQQMRESLLPVHCGLCSKCRERRDAFAAAGIPDPAPYAQASPR